MYKVLLLFILTYPPYLFAASCDVEVSGNPSANRLITDFPTFTKEEVSVMPSLMGITKDQVMAAFTGSTEVNGRTWALGCIEDIDLLRKITERGTDHFTVPPLIDDSMVCPIFDLDKENVWRQKICIIDETRTVGDDGETPFFYFLEFFTELSEKDLRNPFLTGMKGVFSFEKLNRDAPESPVFRKYARDHAYPILARCLKSDEQKAIVVAGINRLI